MKLMSRFSLTLFAALACAGMAHAQTSKPASSKTGMSAQSSTSGTQGGAQSSAAENCGTPDEPRPCPPMPRVPFQSFPGTR